MTYDPAIDTLIDVYLDGLWHADSERLRTVFHPALLYATADEVPARIFGLEAYMAEMGKRMPPSEAGAERNGRVVRIRQVGEATATVELTCAYFGRSYTDFLSLVRDGGRWQVIAKVFSFEEEALCPTSM
ncbi:nuclear transport factor 2 family protein [Parvularcula dongshanensis]|uniref:Nuclear transport factor 2 family protein n=1 Tax=Parvularcula dongshanensis TaxID=1173995 RepID=A0A840I4B1_9PROT|nr:nuclear transport factor 2 family protein [Parvularcula dongshanensis]MBB4659103.1 hypothetical protein [Parvularcula dongshanensis]